MRFTLLSFASCTFALALASLTSVACGGTTNDGGPTADSDAGTETPETGIAVDAAAAVDSNVPDTSQTTSNVYPAVKRIPLVENNGGTIVANPKIVTVTFAGDPLEARLQAFGDVITTTPWWDAVRAGFCQSDGTCIGKGSNGGHVVIPTAPAATYTDVQGSEDNATIQTLIKDQVAAGTFPAPDADTIYVIYFPKGPSISFTSNGQVGKSCQEFGGYHQATTATAPGGKATSVAYAIIPRCKSQEPMTTIAASHEIIEAATDPAVGNNITYYMFNDQAWATASFGGEVADLCADPTNSGSDTIQESGFSVQRSWSNTAAKAGHDPCVPAPAGVPYFNVAPTKDHFTLANGKSLVIEATAFSDGPLDAWNVDVIDLSQYFGGFQPLTVSIDQSQASNGNKVNVTVSMTATGQGLFAITSKNSTGTNYWPILLN